MKPDPRRAAVLGLIPEWDPEAATLPAYLGLSPDQWRDFVATEALPDGYEPREPRERYEPEPRPGGPGRPPGHSVPAETKARIRGLLLAGWSGRAAARECGVSDNTAAAVARKLKEARLIPTPEEPR